MSKTIIAALFATAALASTAHAEKLNDLKSDIESINPFSAFKVSLPQIPNGFDVKPVADAPADAATGEAVEEPFVEVKTSGNIKTGYIFSKIKDGLPAPGDSSSDFDVEGVVTVRASVQSTLGEVGATISAKWDTAESTTNAGTIALSNDGVVGFWQFANTMKFEMGRGNGGDLSQGIEKNTRRIWTTAHRRVKPEKAGNGFYDRDHYGGFFGVNYTDGPITVLLRAHDATRGVTGAAGNDDDAHGVSSKAIFSGEMISFEAAGGYWGQDGAKNLPIASQTGVKWLAGAGTELNFIEGLPLSIAVQMGKLHSGAEKINYSASTSIGLTDEISVAVGAGLQKVKNSPTAADNRTEKAIIGGIYYTPMTYLTLGLEGDWLDDGRPAATANDGFTGAAVARFSF